MSKDILTTKFQEIDKRIKYIEAGQKGKQTVGETFPTSPSNMDQHVKNGVAFIYLNGSWVQFANVSEVAGDLQGNPSWVSHDYGFNGHIVSWSYPYPNEISHYIIYESINPYSTGGSDPVYIGQYNGTSAVLPYSSSSGVHFGIIAVGNEGQETDIVWSDSWTTKPAMVNPRAQLTKDGYLITWGAVNRVKHYNVESSYDSGGSYARNVWIGDSTYSPEIRNGDSWFRVRGIGWADNFGEWSDWVTDDNPPPTPSIVVLDGYDNITVRISDSDTSHTSLGFSHYVLQRADDGSGTNTEVLDARAEFGKFPYVTTQPNTTMYYRVIPYDIAGNQGTASAWIAGTVLLTLGADGVTIEDKFDGYGGDDFSSLQSLHWLSLEGDFGNIWHLGEITGDPVVRDSTYSVEGQYALRTDYINPPDPDYIAFREFSGVIDFTQEECFTDDDYILMVIYLTGITSGDYLYVVFLDTVNTGYFRYSFADTDLEVGYNYLLMKKSDFVVTGLAQWDGIGEFSINCHFEDDNVAHIDDIRIVKADPDDSTTYNDTGTSWNNTSETDDTYGGEWHIYEGNRIGEPSKPFSYGQIETSGGSGYYLSYKPDLDILIGTSQVGIYFRDSNVGGLAFFVQDVSENNWNMYAILASTGSSNNIDLVKWINGTMTVISSASLVITTNQLVWIGVDFREFSTDAGRLKVYASLSEGNLIQAANLVISTQDTGLEAVGTVGLLSEASNVRFVNFRAGSPAHADTADVAYALDGTIVGGVDRRIRYSRYSDSFTRSDDGEVTVYALYPPATRIWLSQNFN